MENGHFWQKPWTNPFGEFRYFWLFQNFIFHVYKTFFCIQNITKQSFLSYFTEKKLSCLLPFAVVLWWELGLAFCTTEKHFEGSLSLRKNESKGKQHGWQAQYGLGWVYPLFVPMGKGWGYFSKICMGWFSLLHSRFYCRHATLWVTTVKTAV